MTDLLLSDISDHIGHDMTVTTIGNESRLQCATCGITFSSENNIPNAGVRGHHADGSDPNDLAISTPVADPTPPPLITTHGEHPRPNQQWYGLKKPSAVHHDDLYVVRLYRKSGGDAQVYTDVKHLWWTADSSVLTVLQYTTEDRREWRTVFWMRETIEWYTMTPQPFD